MRGVLLSLSWEVAAFSSYLIYKRVSTDHLGCRNHLTARQKQQVFEALIKRVCSQPPSMTPSLARAVNQMRKLVRLTMDASV